jgi:hypothetical protein
MRARRGRSLVRGRDRREGRRPMAVCVASDRSVRPDYRRGGLPMVGRDSRSPLLRAGARHDEGSAGGGRHRPGSDLPDGAPGAAPASVAPNRAIRQQPGRGRSRPAEGAPATDARRKQDRASVIMAGHAFVPAPPAWTLRTGGYRAGEPASRTMPALRVTFVHQSWSFITDARRAE